MVAYMIGIDREESVSEACMVLSEVNGLQENDLVWPRTVTATFSYIQLATMSVSKLNWYIPIIASVKVSISVTHAITIPATIPIPIPPW